MDERNATLAKNLVNYSCRLQKGEKILISVTGMSPLPLVKEIIKEVYAAEGLPFVEIKHPTVERELLKNVSDEQLEFMAKIDAERMDGMDAYIGIRGDENLRELSDVPEENLERHMNLYVKPVHYNIRVEKTKWVILRYPNAAMAQEAGKSVEAFEDFFYEVCNLDYSKMSAAMNSLVELMNKTDKVHIVGKGTDLTFSIKDIPAIKCDGLCNIPDGEVYTAPVRDSVNGVISYNATSEYNSFIFSDVCLTFENGKIVKATANDNDRIERIFNMDEGARYVGEFALGVNPYITKPMNNILFDEKIKGSFHFTPGNCYKDAYNGNSSAIHWDLVCIQTQEYGGGEIYFDDVLIRKDGMFIIPELEALNPENLV